MEIYVGNLPYKTSDSDLSNLFSPHGQVASAKIIMDRMTGQSKGFGFVSMPNADEARKAIESLNGQVFMGRPLKINESLPREKAPFRGGPGGGGDRPPRPAPGGGWGGGPGDGAPSGGQGDGGGFRGGDRRPSRRDGGGHGGGGGGRFDRGGSGRGGGRGGRGGGGGGDRWDRRGGGGGDGYDG